ncbi:MAG: 2'-5' RNA ligase [Gammaproteobacteria bacterium RIFCSPHIGHO2_12_FULL_37_14]|nr:MAG: 2'-5' RNA ligase [Gammaproteobacteria bacterium RIFCSPHIGHO2_12_FULL_37_14]
MLKKKSKTNAIRWSILENLHITLQFLPEVHSEHLDRLIQNVRDQLQDKVKSVKLIFDGLELFPNPYRPRVIVLKVISQENLTQLSALIGHGIKASNYELEQRPFRAHLTLGRIKHPHDINLNFLADCRNFSVEAMDINEVILFRSEPLPEGSRYRVLERINFIGA